MKKTICQAIRGLLLVICASAHLSESQSDESHSALKEARREVARRTRRIIFNDDMYELDRKWANSPEGLLRGRLAPLQGTQVDTISFSVIEADAPVYDSKVQPIYGDAHGGPPPYWPNITANIHALAKLGHCPIQIITDFAHKNKMESWAHVRMNDVHDSFIPGWLCTWKKEHPELLVDKTGMLPDYKLYVTAQDFSHEEVRQRKLEIIEEICRRYDIDGFEIDYIRHPVLFSRTMRGLPTTDVQIQTMTSLMRQIRKLTDRTAARRGRPIVLATRVPDTLQQSMHIGLDVKSWLQEDLVDILIPGGGYAPFSLPVADIVNVARDFQVPVYPCINQGPALTFAGDRANFTTTTRALATKWYQAGSDGVYVFNLGTPFEYKIGNELDDIRSQCYDCLYEIGDPKTLLGKDKLYGLDQPVFHHYIFVSSQPPLPLILKSDTTGKLLLAVSDQVRTSVEADVRAKYILELGFKGPLKKNLLRVGLNDQPLTTAALPVTNAGQSKIIYPLSAPPLKMGENVLDFSLKQSGKATDEQVELVAVYLRVIYSNEHPKSS